ncbi:VOC family protein [Bacillus gobiensis]|uniref:VOC family protein n=1 Tax=Bacillus gobiensis TaxID=1441095 RepID=UPI003D22DA0E
MSFQFKVIDHVQLAAPKEGEESARYFFTQILGFKEINKPFQLKKNGGVWFEKGSIHVHVGIEDPFVPAKKAHPAFEIEDLPSFIEHLEANSYPYKSDNRLPGADRIYLADPFENRIEILEWNGERKPL